MANQPIKNSEKMQRSLADLIEASRRLRQKAKENADEAGRLMAAARELERAFKKTTDAE